jgi:GAF domain-containing protein
MPAHPSPRADDPPATGLSAIELVEVGPLQSDDESYLAEVAAVVARALGGSTAVSITIGNPADGAVLVATSRFAHQADDLQARARRGPCQQAWDSGAVVVTDDVSTDDRWRRLEQLAAATALSSVMAIPIEVDGRLAGVLNAYSSERNAYDKVSVTERELVECTVAAALARVAERRSLGGQVTNLERALVSRATIEQAKGILMAEKGLDAETAFRVLRAESQHDNVPVRDLAAELVEKVTAQTP